MRYSKLLGKTQREAPHEVRSISHSLLMKAGLVRQLGQGLFSFLPLGMRVLQKIRKIMSEEMERIGGQETHTPMVSPADLWHRSRRYRWIDKEMIRFEDRHGRELVLSPTAEEVFVELVRHSLSSYRDLPLLLFQLTDKFRDEEKPKAGLVRAKEFIMLDAYSFHRSSVDLNHFFPKLFSAYKTIFNRCSVSTLAAEAGMGYIGGEKSYEFLMPVDGGDDVVIRCPRCGYCANRNIAVGGKDYHVSEPKPCEKIHTAGCMSIDALADFLGQPRHRLAKSLVYTSPEGLVMAVVRADHEIGAEKLSAYLRFPVHRLASNEELIENGLVPGYFSPLGVPDSMRVIVDDTVTKSNNLVFGANEEGFHLLNVNYGRDFTDGEVADIALTRGKSRCLICGASLEEISALELGHIYKLGDYFCRTLELSFQEDDGRPVHPSMSCSGIGLGRLLDAVVQANHDERGIIWPPSLAPFAVFLMGVGSSLAVKRVLEQLHLELEDLALYDDREESPGEKFMDGDLLGIPLRLVVSGKHLAQGKVELRDRRTGAVAQLDPAQAAREIRRRVQETA